MLPRAQPDAGPTRAAFIAYFGAGVGAAAGGTAGTGGVPGFGVLSVAAATASMLSSLVTEFCEIAVTDDLVATVVEAILKSAGMGKIGDGKIFVYDLAQVTRIRTGETGPDAL